MLHQVYSSTFKKPENLSNILDVLKLSDDSCLFYRDKPYYVDNKKTLTRLVRKRSFYKSMKPLPGTSKVTKAWIVHTEIFGPVQGAIRVIQSGTDRLANMLAEAKISRGTSTIFMILAGMVNAGVQGGISNYIEFFETGFMDHPEIESQKPFLSIFKNTLVDQSGVISEAINFCEYNGQENMHQIRTHFVAYQKSLVDDFKVQPDQLRAKLGDFYMQEKSLIKTNTPKIVANRNSLVEKIKNNNSNMYNTGK